MEEVLLDAGQPKIDMTQTLVDQALAQMDFELKIFGLKDPNTDLMADPNFIVNYKKNDTHLAFYKALRKRAGTGMINFCHKEIFNETSKEWQMAFDPVNTEKRCARYNRPLPESFLWREEEMVQWRAIMERRADFTHIKADQGEVINDIIDGIMKGYIKDKIEEKERQKVKKNDDDL